MDADVIDEHSNCARPNVSTEIVHGVTVGEHSRLKMLLYENTFLCFCGQRDPVLNYVRQSRFGNFSVVDEL